MEEKSGVQGVRIHNKVAPSMLLSNYTLANYVKKNT